MAESTRPLQLPRPPAHGRWAVQSPTSSMEHAIGGPGLAPAEAFHDAPGGGDHPHACLIHGADPHKPAYARLRWCARRRSAPDTVLASSAALGARAAEAAPAASSTTPHTDGAAANAPGTVAATSQARPASGRWRCENRDAVDARRWFASGGSGEDAGVRTVNPFPG